MRTQVLRACETTLKKASDLLLAGEVVGVPTETVYGLAADATNSRAVAKIFAVKERPFFSPLIIQVATIGEARKWVKFSPQAERVAHTFWPGALTLVLRKKHNTGLSDLVSPNQDTLGIRISAHPVILALLSRIQRPLAIPSANHFASFSPTRAENVLVSLEGKIPLVIDGGPCSVGIESTILDMSEPEPRILRPGSIQTRDIEALIGPVPTATPTWKTPGFVRHHTPLRLRATTKKEHEVMLGFGADEQNQCDLNLSPAGDLEEAATHFFQMLHDLDARGAKGIAVMPIPDEGLGIAINNRLERMASG